jgi:hypothetical protein
MRNPLIACGWLMAGALCVAGGCASGDTGFIQGPVYPSNMQQSGSLNIQVFRESTRIRFTNTTASSIPACTMWVNAWFSRPLEEVSVGETVELSLFDFKDQFGDEFRAGGFFATDKPTKLVLAQLELPAGAEGQEGLVGLVVVNEFDE